MYQSTVDGRFLEVDPLLAAMLGYASADEMIASIQDIATQFYVDPGARRRLMGLVAEQGTVLNFETQVYRKDGDALWVAEYSRPLRAAGGAITGYCGAFADISIYKHVTERLAQAHLQLANEMASLRHTVAGSRRRILVKDGTRVKFVETSKITFIKADGDYVHVHTAGGERTMARDRISSVERRIDSSIFVRISKSALVNVNYIKELHSRRRGDYVVLLDGGEQLLSGPTYRETMKRLLGELR